jgi:hypothetical protein
LAEGFLAGAAGAGFAAATGLAGAVLLATFFLLI